ncbi:MAG: alpha/beta hydrolase [Acidobacteriota bacterium]
MKSHVMSPDLFLKRIVQNKLFHLEEGPKGGKPILLIHGITGSHRYWNTIRKKLAKNNHLIIPDLLGFGYSPKPYIHYSVDIFRDSLRSLLLSKNLEHHRIILIGHSLGTIIAAEYAAAYPGQVAGLVLISIPAFPNEAMAHRIFWRGSASYRNLLTTNSFSANFSQIWRSGFNMSLTYLSRIPFPVLIDSRKFTFRSLTSTLENCLLKYRADQFLSRLNDIPVLALHGERDQVSPLSGVIDLAKKLPELSLKVIKHSGHHIVLTHPQECLHEIERFLDRLA